MLQRVRAGLAGHAAPIGDFGPAVVVGVGLAAGACHAVGALEAAETRACIGASKPGVAQGLVGCEAVARAHLQESQDEVKCSLGDVLPGLLWKAEVPLHYLPVELVQHVVEEWQRTTQEHISDDAYCPDIDLAPIFLLLDDLRGKVEIRTANGVGPGQAARVVPGDLRQPEVRDLDVCVADLAGKQNVLRLEVTVHDSAAMDVGHSIEELVAAELGLMLGVILLLLDAVVKLPALAEFQNEPYASRK
mmetsp:Transcript_17562/g.41231  ORF Transcript_17562/g.41231 Transcript_17562/m.41231 type:complete len:247 (+) Transcript_17562:235-975(+)